MKKNIRSAFIVTFSFLSCCLTSFNAFALVCEPATPMMAGDAASSDSFWLATGEARSQTDNISVLAYLKNAAIGERIWTSRVFTQQVGCKSELDNNGTENVYIYPFPKLVSTDLPAGVTVGLILDGEDLGEFDPNKGLMERRKKLDWVVNSTLTGKYMSFQIYLKKTGEIGSASAKSITIFQLDGVGGLNGSEENFNISLTGWENMGSVDCNTVNSSLNAKLTGFNSDSILKGEATQTVNNALAININCTSDNSAIPPQIKTFTGALTLSGSSLTDNSNYFSTNKENLGLGLRSQSHDFLPSKAVILSFPLSSGSAAQQLSVDVTPYLPSMSLKQPEWLFSEEGTSDITSSIPYSFVVTGISTD